MTDTLHLHAVIHARPDSVDEMKSLLESLIPPTRQETGCLGYVLMQDRDDPARFVFVEEWTNEKALEQHFETEHMKTALPRFEELSAKELELIRLSRVS